MANHVYARYDQAHDDAVYVSIDKRPALPRERNGLSDGQLIAWAELVWKHEDEANKIADDLRSRNVVSVVMCGPLPWSDTKWEDAPGHYIYTLKSRRSGGKYVIAEAVLDPRYV